MFNSGVPGQQTSQMVSRFAADITAKHPALVSILAGANDIGAVSNPDAAAITNNLQSMVSAATADGSKVILCTLLPRNKTPGVPLDSGQVTALNSVNAWIRTRAVAGSVWVADWTVQMSVGDGVTPNSSYFTDDLHPNSAGYEVMASVYTPVLGQVRASLP